MEMTLRLPMNYVEVENDEMEYIDGGVGYTYAQINKVVKGFSAANRASHNALKATLVPIIPVMFSWLNAIPVVGQALFGVVCMVSLVAAGTVATAYFMKKGISIGFKGISLN